MKTSSRGSDPKNRDFIGNFGLDVIGPELEPPFCARFNDDCLAIGENLPNVDPFCDLVGVDGAPASLAACEFDMFELLLKVLPFRGWLLRGELPLWAWLLKGLWWWWLCWCSFRVDLSPRNLEASHWALGEI